MPYSPAPGPAVVGPFADVEELRGRCPRPDADQPISTQPEREAACLHLALDQLRSDGTIRFGSRLFSALCQAVEGRGGRVDYGWVTAYRLTWTRLLLAQSASPPSPPAGA
jgi:hypothetical protein